MVNFTTELKKLKQGMNVYVADKCLVFKYLKGSKCKCVRVFLTPKKIWLFGTLWLTYTTTIAQDKIPEWVNYC